MEKLIKETRIILIILAIIAVAGIVVIATVGFNFELSMQSNKRIELYIQKDFKISDIKDITNEVLQNKDVVIQKVEVFEDTVSITVREITEEEKEKLIEKINEKYELELSTDEIEINEMPNMKFMDLISHYIFGFSLASILILLYMIIRYKKLGVSRILIKTILTIIIPQILLFSIIAITRIPVGRFTVPMVIVVYLTSLFVYTYNLEKQLAKIREDED